MSKEAMKLALEALEWCHGGEPCGTAEAITALREALAEQPAPPGWIDELAKVPDNAWPAQQEPFGYFRYDLRLDAWVQNRAGLTGTPLYTSPPASKPWVGLTDEEVEQGLLRSDYALQTAHAWRAGVVFAMAKLKEKNT